MSRKRESKSLTQKAYQQIRRDLLACRVMPGSKLNIAEMSARLGYSPGAVREALSRLTAEGLVTSVPQRGFQAAPISAEDLRQLTAARIEMERLCARRAVEEGDIAWESALVAAHHELSRTPTTESEDDERVSDAWATAHFAFHDTLVAGCNNRYLLEARRTLFNQGERYRRLSIPHWPAGRDLGAEHRGLMDAALERDGDRLVDLIVTHVGTTADVLGQRLFGDAKQAPLIELAVETAAEP